MIDVPRTAEELRTAQRESQRETARKLRQDIATEQAYGWLFIITALAPAEAFLLMLVLGALHSVFAPVAAVGYGTAYLLVLGVDLAACMTGRFRRPKQ
ncbi:hypothetical protein PV332_10510 [Streptomyces scabiei]|uniref:hypothetical protein n=1 Tax=Streptomyces scabiei TaxID=1930 RepID=UPI0029AA07F5|nr:hypothetical protein [Streptomyces scabiei]MDX2575912.1 hypothetical protein [Streptomyces scabiei]MDX2885615.1 hypothetical protein [Streptomyces scabiei]MDX2993432.1 hypothetical protein [Streptomyces scabiei]MDX3028454.1 hypothetical protein [Streptomyces scabiei]MDX3047212.1 hypothetical protein [Streptomyces scabiei]